MPLAAMAIPLATSLGGAALGAFGGSGKQGSQTQNSTSTEDFTQSTKNTEQEYFKQFRQDLIPMFMGLMKTALKPVYGNAQVADQIQKSNDLGKSSMESFKSMLAGTGKLKSGAGALGASEIEKSRIGQIGSFMQQLPFQNMQAMMANATPLMNLGAQWAGRAPIDTTTTGKGTKVTNGTVEQQGPSWLKSFASGLGGAMGRQPGMFNGLMPTPGGMGGFNGWDWYSPKVDGSIADAGPNGPLGNIDLTKIPGWGK